MHFSWRLRPERVAEPNERHSHWQRQNRVKRVRNDRGGESRHSSSLRAKHQTIPLTPVPSVVKNH